MNASDFLHQQTPAEMRQALEALNEQGARVLLALNAEMEQAEKDGEGGESPATVT